jgi:hypothetical protein
MKRHNKTKSQKGRGCFTRSSIGRVLVSNPTSPATASDALDIAIKLATDKIQKK